MTQDEAQKQIDEKIESFKKRAEELSSQLKTEVTYRTFSERINKLLTGNVFVAYIRQPHYLVAVKCMDFIVKDNYYQAGNLIWDACILSDESSKEIQQDKYKVGLCGELGLMLDIQAPDIKKN